MASSMTEPRWSRDASCHKGECALMSAVMIELERFVV